MEISPLQLQNIIRATAKEAVAEYIRQSNPATDEITEAKAVRIYGKGNLRHWMSLGLLTYKRAGVHKNSPKIYSIKALDELSRGVDPLLNII
jgi:hypothetical protein